jgi:hypothetical protein
MIELCHCEQSDFVSKRRGRPKMKKEAKKHSNSSTKYDFIKIDYQTANLYRIQVEMRTAMSKSLLSKKLIIISIMVKDSRKIKI